MSRKEPSSDRVLSALPRVTGWGVARYPPGATFGPRRMGDFEFVWMLEGEAVYTSDGARFDLAPGAVVLCRQGSVDSFEWDRKRRALHGYFHFTLEPPATLPAPSGWPVVRPARSGDSLIPLARHVAHWAPRGDAAMLGHATLALLHAFVLDQSHVGRHDSIGPKPLAVERAIAFIYRALDEHPQQPPGFEQIADVSGVTGEHLCRLFARHVGHSPMQTQMLARLDRGLSLVVRSNYSVKEIAALVGFATPFHFTRRFSESFGISPSELRQRVQRGEQPPLPRLLEGIDRGSSSAPPSQQ